MSNKDKRCYPIFPIMPPNLKIKHMFTDKITHAITKHVFQ